VLAAPVVVVVARAAVRRVKRARRLAELRLAELRPGEPAARVAQAETPRNV
jgi:hypothetical protein